MQAVDSGIYLASRSPRRQALLKQVGIGFTVLEGDIDETPLPEESPKDYVTRMALTKAQAGRTRMLEQQLQYKPVLAADTTVVLDKRILGKPIDSADACDMLKSLSGKDHQVMSAVSVINNDRVETVLSVSDVSMDQLTDEQIARYVASGEPKGKAGSYAVQGAGAALIKRIEGSYSGVMGLPLYETVSLLKGFDIACWQSVAIIE